MCGVHGEGVNRYTTHTPHLNAYSCSQFVCTALHIAQLIPYAACLKAQDCASFENSHSISRAMSHAMHGTRSTSSSSFSSVPGLQRLITYGKPFADSRELHGGDC